MRKNKKLMILVACLITVIGVSFAYFAATTIFSGNGASVSGTTAVIGGSELRVEGSLAFNDLNIYPGHQNVSSIKVTAIGENELIPYNVIWEGTNTLNTPLNFTVYKTSSEVDVSASCKQTKGVVDGALRYYEECSISNIDQLGSIVASGTINTNQTKATLVEDEFITSTNDGISVYYYVILEYPNLDENQNSDIGGTFSGEVTVEESGATPDINIIAAYIEQEDGSYEETSEIPQEGYVINQEKSVCSNGAVPTGFVPNITINNLSKSGTSCYLYFDIERMLKNIILANKTISDARNEEITGTLTMNTTGTVYRVADDDGDSYVFAGAPTDNWVQFAGYYWRIIRINGDGSIRLIYNGTSTATTGSGTMISSSQAFNSSYNDNAYIGYMYGSTGVSSYASTHTNTNNSSIKTVVDNWYRDNLSQYAQYISTEAGFCGDRRIATSTENWWTSDTKLGYNKKITAYAPFSRFSPTNNSWKSIQTPTLKCSQSNDLYTVSESSKGNHALTYPIGLITADEVVLAGGFGGTLNKSYYLYNNAYYWTMSPYFFASTNHATEFMVTTAGNLGASDVDGKQVGVRPVINLLADVMISSGDGTTSNPYVVVDSE